MIRHLSLFLCFVGISVQAQHASSNANSGLAPVPSPAPQATRTLSVVGSYTTPGGIAAPCAATTNVNNNTVTGGGRAACNQWEFINNGWGRNVGSSPQPRLASQWQVSQFFKEFLYSHTAGISEFRTEVFDAMNGGDKSMQRWWFNFLPGNTEDGSGEGAKGVYFNMHGMGDYVGTVNTGYSGTGLTYIQTTGTCKNAGTFSPTYCIGSPRPLIQPANPIFTANVTAQTNPTVKTYGTLTLDISTLIPTAHGTLANNIPDTTNYKDGSGFTTTYTPVAGTMPEKGLMCVWGTNSPRLETLSYSLSGSTLTVTGGHRDPIVTLDASNAPIQAWAGACKGFISNPDAAVDGKKAMWWYLGNINANTIAYVAIDRNNPYSGGLGSPVSSFRAGVSGSNRISAYQVAEVVATYNQTSGYGTLADGSMELALNDMTWTPGTQVEQVFTPSSRAMLMDLNCDPGTMSSNGLNACVALSMGRDTDAALDVVLNNPIAETTAGSGLRSPLPQIFRVRSTSTALGAYANLFSANVAPQTSLFWIGCQAGDATAECSKSTSYDLFHLKGANGGGKIEWYPRYAALSLQNVPRFVGSYNNGNAVTFTQLYIGGSSSMNDGALTFAKRNDALNNWNGSCPTCTQTTQRTNIAMLDPDGSGSTLDLVVGNKNAPSSGSFLPLASADGGVWLGTSHASVLSEAAQVNAAYHQSGSIPTTVYSGTHPTALTTTYFLVPLYPNGTYGVRGFRPARVPTPSTLDDANTTTTTCPKVVEAGYPSGTTYHLIRAYGASGYIDVGVCPLGRTLVDRGGGSPVDGVLNTNVLTFNGSGDSTAARFIANVNGKIGFWSNTNSVNGSIDTALTRTGGGTVALGNGTQGDTSGTLTLRSVQLTSASMPCTSAQRGQFNYIAGGPGVKDTVQVCAKDAADIWAWRTLY